MRKKVGTVLDEELIWAAKALAARQKQSLSAIIEQALKAYISRSEKKDGRPNKSVVARSRGALQIPRAQLKAALAEEGLYEA